MALEDVAKLIAHKRPDVASRILNVFYLRDTAPTKEELIEQAGLTRKTLEYYMARLNYWRLLYRYRRWHCPTRYELSPGGFHARIDTLLCDPIYHLAGGYSRNGRYLVRVRP